MFLNMNLLAECELEYELDSRKSDIDKEAEQLSLAETLRVHQRRQCNAVVAPGRDN